MREIKKAWKKGLEKSRSLRLLRRLILVGAGALTALLIVRRSK